MPRGKKASVLSGTGKGVSCPQWAWLSVLQCLLSVAPWPGHQASVAGLYPVMAKVLTTVPVPSYS